MRKEDLVSKLIVKSGSPTRKSPPRIRTSKTTRKKAPKKVRKAKKASKVDDGGAGKRAKICQAIAVQDRRRSETRQVLDRANEHLLDLKIQLGHLSDPIGYLVVVGEFNRCSKPFPLTFVIGEIRWGGLSFHTLPNGSICIQLRHTDIRVEMRSCSRLSISDAEDMYAVHLFSSRKEAKRFLLDVEQSGIDF